MELEQLKSLNPSDISSLDYGELSDLAEAPDTPNDTMLLLSKDVDSEIRYKIAENRKTSPEILVDLAVDENWTVQWTAVANPNSPVKALVSAWNTMRRNSYIDVVSSLYNNPNTPPWLKATIRTTVSWEWRL